MSEDWGEASQLEAVPEPPDWGVVVGPPSWKLSQNPPTGGWGGASQLEAVPGPSDWGLGPPSWKLSQGPPTGGWGEPPSWKLSQNPHSLYYYGDCLESFRMVHGFTRGHISPFTPIYTLTHKLHYPWNKRTHPIKDFLPHTEMYFSFCSLMQSNPRP